MTLLIKRELASFAHHQNIGELRCTDCGCRAPALPNFLIITHLRPLPENRTEREQAGVAIHNHASIDLRDAFQDRRR